MTEPEDYAIYASEARDEYDRWIGSREVQCLCGHIGPDPFGNYTRIEDSECPVHGDAE